MIKNNNIAGHWRAVDEFLRLTVEGMSNLEEKLRERIDLEKHETDHIGLPTLCPPGPVLSARRLRRFAPEPVLSLSKGSG